MHLLGEGSGADLVPTNVETKPTVLLDIYRYKERADTRSYDLDSFGRGLQATVCPRPAPVSSPIKRWTPPPTPPQKVHLPPVNVPERLLDSVVVQQQTVNCSACGLLDGESGTDTFFSTERQPR